MRAKITPDIEPKAESMKAAVHPRQDIYYWKCDRPVAFYGIRGPSSQHSPVELEQQLRPVLEERFPGQAIALYPGQGQGNHTTFTGTIDDRPVFVRIEDGPEHDDYMEVESHVIDRVAAEGVPVAGVIAADASRTEVPFAWQVLARIAEPDLNHHAKAGVLRLSDLAGGIGRNLARWQNIRPIGFGPFDPAILRNKGRLQGFHESYADYFFARLDRHLAFLTEQGFLRGALAAEFGHALRDYPRALECSTGVLVHKDLALWNILGAPDHITAFIDWDDAISGDVLDDISLLACFHDGQVIAKVLAGYTETRALPGDYRCRFWLHLLRNMITKAVIRVGAGYFKRADNFFLIGPGGTGLSLEAATRRRLDMALNGLRENTDPSTL